MDLVFDLSEASLRQAVNAILFAWTRYQEACALMRLNPATTNRPYIEFVEELRRIVSATQSANAEVIRSLQSQLREIVRITTPGKLVLERPISSSAPTPKPASER